MDDKTIRVAMNSVDLELPSFITRKNEKYDSEQGAAKNIRWILRTLARQYDNKTRPPLGLLIALNGLSDVADLLEDAAKINMCNPTEGEFLRHKNLRKKADNALLECFGLRPNSGELGTTDYEIIGKMAMLLSPPLNDEDDRIGDSSCRSIQAAAKEVGRQFDVSYKTVERTWKKYEKQFSFEDDK